MSEGELLFLDNPLINRKYNESTLFSPILLDNIEGFVGVRTLNHRGRTVRSSGSDG